MWEIITNYLEMPLQQALESHYRRQGFYWPSWHSSRLDIWLYLWSLRNQRMLLPVNYCIIEKDMKRMNERQINLLVGILYSLSALFLLAGAFFSLQENQLGVSWIIAGFMLGTVVSTFDTFRLRKKIRKLEEQLRHYQAGKKP